MAEDKGLAVSSAPMKAGDPPVAGKKGWFGFPVYASDRVKKMREDDPLGLKQRSAVKRSTRGGKR